MAANLHPDHDTVAVFRRSNKAANEAALLHVLLLTRSRAAAVGHGFDRCIKIDVNASKLRSVRYDRAKQLRTKVADDIAASLAQAEAADIETHDPQSFPGEPWRIAIKAKMDTDDGRTRYKLRKQTVEPVFGIL